ncbi:MAG: phosphoglycerate dehydrogenase [Planctomycetota bacterium]
MTATATQTFTILAADKLAQQGLDWINAQDDAELLDRPDLVELKKEQGQEAVDVEVGKLLAAGGVHAMVVRSGIKVTAPMLENPGDLKVIARAGVGVDNIDLQAATDKGILVVNTAEASTITTAEHAFALMISLLRNIGPAYETMHAGGWDRAKFKGRQLSGMTLGVVGFGRIGQTMAKRALAFGMNVVAFDPVFNSPTALDGKVKMFTDFEAMLPDVDVLSFHVPLNDHTRGMLNTATFAKCKDGVYVVNAARGGVVDEASVIPALESGKCAGAALDVFTSEPPPEDSPLRQHPKLLVTPHLGASTQEAQTAVSSDAAIACMAYLRGEGIKGAVNAGNLRVDLDPTQNGFVDLASRMAALISPMITRGIATVSIELAGKSLHKAAGTVERAAMVGLLREHLADPVNMINVAQVAESRGIKIKTATIDEPTQAGPALTIEVHGPEGAVDGDTLAADRTRKIVGRVYEDLRPRVVEINGYQMDMTPDGTMVLLQNEDLPGMIGHVGTAFGGANVNIADMTISRRDQGGGKPTALMTLKVDGEPPADLVEQLKQTPGVLKIAVVKLPGS